MKYDEINHKRVSDLTPTDVQALLASTGKAPCVMLCTEQGLLTSHHPSGVVHPFGATGVFTLGTVAWLRVANTQPGAAWCSLQAWAAGLSAAPESIRSWVSTSRQLPAVGKHVRDLTRADIAVAQEYALAKNHNAVEFDITPSGRVSGAYVVDAPRGLYSVEGAAWGATIGAAAVPEQAIAVLQLQEFIEKGGTK